MVYIFSFKQSDYFKSLNLYKLPFPERDLKTQTTVLGTLSHYEDCKNF